MNRTEYERSRAAHPAGKAVARPRPADAGRDEPERRTAADVIVALRPAV